MLRSSYSMVVTGISERDMRPEAVEPLLDKEIPGFGEAFRYLSYEEVGLPAILSKATAGKMDESLIFALPGSTAAVELALKELILPEMGHMIYEVNK